MLKRIRLAQEKDIPACLELEQMFSERSPDAQTHGFLLSGGESEQAFREAVGSNTFWVLYEGSEIAAFLFVLSPTSERLEKLKLRAGEFDLEQGEKNPFHLQQVSWLGKVAVHRNYRRQGNASALYETLFQSYPTWNFLTTTVSEPIENLPSRSLQTKLGFREIGKWKIGDKGSLLNVQCRLHFREQEKAE